VSSRTDYTAEEWTALVRAPLLAGLALTLADPGGPIEAAKEAIATMKMMSAPDSQTELLVAVSQEAKSMMEDRKNPLDDFKPGTSQVGQEVLAEMRKVNSILSAKASPQEAADFVAWLMRAAQSAADAAKEGGFLGFGAVRVSEGEQEMLDQLKTVLGGAAAGTGAGATAEEAAPRGGENDGVPKIDLDLCTGCGICEDICPAVFEIGDDGYSHVIDEYGCGDAGCCQEAIDECPEGAISME
jgi:ferredoxin